MARRFLYSHSLAIVWLTSLIPNGVNAVLCYSCQYAVSHDDCLILPEITCDIGHICYTEIQRREFEGRRFYKGCMERNRCYGQMALHDNIINCKEVGKYCTYCCEGDLCNAYNAAARWRFCTISDVLIIGITGLILIKGIL